MIELQTNRWNTNVLEVAINAENLHAVKFETTVIERYIFKSFLKVNKLPKMIEIIKFAHILPKMIEIIKYAHNLPSSHQLLQNL